MKPLNEWSSRDLLSEIDRYGRFRQWENSRHARAVQDVNGKIDALEAELAHRRQAGETDTTDTH